MQNNEKIMVGLSGGVDSSVSALLLRKQGFEIEGLFMKNWEEDDSDQFCAAAEDVKDAQSICDKIGIKLNTVNFSIEYWEEVFERFVKEYSEGLTPNPDILCNREIKFKAFLEHATDLGAEKIATGHYARVSEKDEEYFLLRGKDQNKDQSYFLYTLGQKELSRTLFPVGELDKLDVRSLAEAADLITHDKKDSTGICFIGERPFREFLSKYIPAQAGEIQTVDGKVIGHHTGAMYYTFGQRKGLGIGGVKGVSEEPWFVVDKDVEKNIIVAGQGHDHPMLFSEGLEATELNWVAGAAPEGVFKCTAKTRYRQTDQKCVVEKIAEDRFRVMFDQPQRAVTPGQSVVFYDDDICLGGGVIQKIIKEPN
ncbi:MAG: tRNA 2-thiouridine(34) synthase MnmA [Gammaproteobacteria bacterium]